MLKNNLVIHTKWEAEHIDLIEKTALEIWGDNITFGEIEDLGAPWPEFEWPVKIYSFPLKFIYDRSYFDIAIPVEDGFRALSYLTDEPMLLGRNSLKPQNLFHNLKVLDRYLQQKMKEQN